MKWLVISMLIHCALGVFEQPAYPPGHVESFNSMTCINYGAVTAQIGFYYFINPYGTYPYDTTIVGDCYAVFPSETDRTQYEIVTSTDPSAMQAMNDTTLGLGTVYLTHYGPCGACSRLSDLALYLTVTDLTTPVKNCGLQLTEAGLENCLLDIGFTDGCMYIWKYNTQQTKKSDANGGCLGVCLQAELFGLDNNEPTVGSLGNPCNPTECGNTINGGPACSDFQWQDGQYRLNACLQCDECRSGPVFQKYAGRTRRGSGIPSAIDRPPETVIELTHYYGLVPFPTPSPTFSPLPPGGSLHPTESPTTLMPSIAPTRSPSQAPSTPYPTAYPSLLPTAAPEPEEGGLGPITPLVSATAAFFFAATFAGAYIRYKRGSALSPVKTTLNGSDAMSTDNPLADEQPSIATVAPGGGVDQTEFFSPRTGQRISF